MAATDTEPVADLDRIEADATARLAELTEQRGPLSLESLVDSAVHVELESVESEIRACERVLERVNLARAEQGLRDAKARAEDEAKRRAVALDRARVLQVEREAAAQAVDAAMAALAESAAWWLRACAEQDRALHEAGRSQGSSAVRMRPFALQGAFAWATRSLRGMLALDVVVPPRNQQRLVDADVRPIEPPAEK